jgi:hypothetical protein
MVAVVRVVFMWRAVLGASPVPFPVGKKKPLRFRHRRGKVVWIRSEPSRAVRRDDDDDRKNEGGDREGAGATEVHDVGGRKSD